MRGESSFRIGDWRVEPELNLATGPSGPVKLQPRLMEVLVYLAQRPGKVVTKEDLIRHVWNGAFVTDEALTYTISALRKALGDDAKESRLIQTIPKKGYRLIGWVEGGAGPTSQRGVGLSVIAGVAVVLLGIIALVLIRSSEKELPVSGTTPSIAVLYFEDLSRDPELEWLRGGLTEMLVTDLSQSPDLKILNTNRLYGILVDLNRVDESSLSDETVRQIAERTGVETIILGSFMEAGENIRINIRVQDVASGEILATESVQGVGESSVFAMVDDLTGRVRRHLEVPVLGDGLRDRDLIDVTTTSLEAYRYYLEARELDRRGGIEDAIVLAEKAVQLDPEFASALIDLSSYHYSLDHQKEWAEYSRLALEHADRVTPREKYYIEGSYYSLKEETFDRALEAFAKAAELDPSDELPWFWLGYLHFVLERYEEAIEYYQRGIGARSRNAKPYVANANSLIACYNAVGKRTESYDVVQSLLRAYPDRSLGYISLANWLTFSGRLDEALDAYREAEAREPDDPFIEGGRSIVFLFRNEWDRSDEAVRRALSPNQPGWDFWARYALAVNKLYRGRSAEALEMLQEAASIHPDQPTNTAFARTYRAHVFLEAGDPARALKEADGAQREASGDLLEWVGLFFAASAQARQRQMDRALRTADELERKAWSLPSEKEKRRYYHLAGELAMNRGEIADAKERLTQATSMLSARGESRWWYLPQHVPIWYSLGSVYLAAGEADNAALWFHRIIESRTERMDWPIPYVRSFYFLAQIHEERDEPDKARAYYQRFVDHWRDGDIDRERVEEALAKIES